MPVHPRLSLIDWCNMQARQGLAKTMHVDEQDEPQVRARLAALQLEHRDLDDAIHRLTEGVYVDQLQLRRMKKRKLVLKDAIARLESMLIPDLDA